MKTACWVEDGAKRGFDCTVPKLVAPGGTVEVGDKIIGCPPLLTISVPPGTLVIVSMPLLACQSCADNGEDVDSEPHESGLGVGYES